MEPRALPPSVCLWDFASLHLCDYQLSPLVRHVRETVSLESGKCVEKGFLVACDVRGLAPSTSKALNRIRNLDLVHVDNGAAEEKLKQKLHQFDIDYRHSPGTIALISGNPEFGYFLANMSRSGWRVLLFHPPGVSSELLDCVDFAADLRPALEAIELDPSVVKPSLLGPPGCPAYLLISRLPRELSLGRLVGALTEACAPAEGDVVYANRLTGEAVLTYCLPIQEPQGATCLFLSRACREAFNCDLGVLAVKDPCGELARMRFTVQQVPSMEETSGSSLCPASSGVSSASHSPATDPHPEEETLHNRAEGSLGLQEEVAQPSHSFPTEESRDEGIHSAHSSDDHDEEFQDCSTSPVQSPLDSPEDMPLDSPLDSPVDSSVDSPEDLPVDVPAVASSLADVEQEVAEEEPLPPDEPPQQLQESDIRSLLEAEYKAAEALCQEGAFVDLPGDEGGFRVVNYAAIAKKTTKTALPPLPPPPPKDDDRRSVASREE